MKKRGREKENKERMLKRVGASARTRAPIKTRGRARSRKEIESVPSGSLSHLILYLFTPRVLARLDRQTTVPLDLVRVRQAQDRIEWQFLFVVGVVHSRVRLFRDPLCRLQRGPRRG